jgi:hypothetical protein
MSTSAQRTCLIVTTTLLAMAIGSPASYGASSQNYGLPLGTLSVTTLDPTLVPWPGEPADHPHHQMLATQLYTSASDEWYAAGVKFDPHGAVGIRRFFQKRDPNRVLECPTEIAVLTKDMPANSRFNQAQQNQNFGPYEPDQSTYCNSNLASNSVYGVETIELVFVDGLGNQHILDYQKIDIYKPTTTVTSDYSTQAAVKTTYSGDAPRVLVQLSNIYPGTETWVGVYPQNGNPQSATKLPNTDWTSPSGDQSNRSVYVDPGSALSGSGTYVLQAFEMTSSGAQPIGQ